MGQWVTRSYLKKNGKSGLFESREKKNFFVQNQIDFCQKTSQYEEELRDKKFNTANSHNQKWFIIYFLKDNDRITIFPVKKDDWKINSKIFC